MQTLNTLNTHTSRRLPGGVEVIQTDRYWLASVAIGAGYLNLEAYPHHATGVPVAMHWSTDGKYGKSIMGHLERRCDETWAEWFAWLDDQWPNHELRWAFELLAAAFPDVPKVPTYKIQIPAVDGWADLKESTDGGPYTVALFNSKRSALKEAREVGGRVVDHTEPADCELYD